ncbi:MAG: EamA family transporter [Lentisphaerae bacterium]|nr:EamA family transporter [Lentisphaerota bacterium]MCP4102767.1 EamA family transporter [Lentisphaerota bacterium]
MMANILLILVAFTNAAGLTLFKKAAVKDVGILSKVFDFYFITGCSLLALSPIIMAIASRYATFSKMYCFTSLSYVFILIFARFTLKEEIDLPKILGTLLIIVGLILMQ